MEEALAIKLGMLPCDQHTDMLQADARSLHGVHVAYDHTLGLSAAGGASASAAAAAPSKYRSAFFFLGLASAASGYTCQSEDLQAKDVPNQELKLANIRPQMQAGPKTQMHINTKSYI